MTLADLNPNQPTLAESLKVTRLAEPARPVNPLVSPISCNTVNQLVKQIDSAKVREIVGTIFGDLLRLLECLRPIESHLHEVDEAKETFALFQAIHDEAWELVKFIREALTCEGLNEELADTLDAISFAVSHDLHRVFETRLPAATEERTDRIVLGKVFRAHDLLTNCLQQATVTLATMFDPELDGTKLFSDSDMRYRQSVQLCEDLSTLLKLIEACGERPVKRAFTNLTAGIKKFLNESMERLRYSDWPEFESFCERTQLAATPSELEPVLHQFRCYVETLLGQVKMRAVLANVVPVEFGGADIQHLPVHNSSTQTYSPIHFQDESVSRGTLPIAI
jgi:hypothetical protein